MTDRRPPRCASPADDLLWTQKMAADRLNMSVHTLKNCVGEPWPKPIRHGRQVFYSVAGLRRAIEILSAYEVDPRLEDEPESPEQAIRGGRHHGDRALEAC